MQPLLMHYNFAKNCSPCTLEDMTLETVVPRADMENNYTDPTTGLNRTFLSENLLKLFCLRWHFSHTIFVYISKRLLDYCDSSALRILLSSSSSIRVLLLTLPKSRINCSKEASNYRSNSKI